MNEADISIQVVDYKNNNIWIGCCPSASVSRASACMSYPPRICGQAASSDLYPATGGPSKRGRTPYFDLLVYMSKSKGRPTAWATSPWGCFSKHLSSLLAKRRPIVADIWGLGWVSPQHAPSTAILLRCLMPRYLLRREDESFPLRLERVLMGLPRSTAGSICPH